MIMMVVFETLSSVWAYIHSGHFYSASSSPLLLRSASDTARISLLCRSFTPKRHRQLRVKDLPKVTTWRQERDSNPRPSGRKASALPMCHLSICDPISPNNLVFPTPNIFYKSTPVSRPIYMYMYACLLSCSTFVWQLYT